MAAYKKMFTTVASSEDHQADTMITKRPIDGLTVPSQQTALGHPESLTVVERHGQTDRIAPLQVSGQENSVPAGGVEDCSWTDVLQSMQNASSEYRAKSESNRLRAAQRDKSIAMTLLSLTEMIPEQDGLSILRGGLSTIFKVT